ncbi:MAG: hypothetical protein HYR63_11525 [Proteobacteria bacterium]|nr:hypothetical protein [Pseudomonadota bacterium]MBI3496347.1 hypothetical protein [Pseudomonadota bacterium]
MQAAIPIARLTGSFDIAEGSPDIELLAIVEKGLRFVREIRPGDTVPSELLDGSASWTVTSRHLEASQARFSMQLVSWLNGKQLDTLDGHAFADMLEDPEVKAKVQHAFGAIAQKLGLDSDRRQEVVDKIDQLVREFSYIEALRSRSFKVKRISSNLRSLGATYKRERSIYEEIGRAQSLIGIPVSKLGSLFDQIDANTGEILSLLRKHEETIEYIRRMRDDLHQQLMRWDELIAAWDEVTIERSADNERRIRQTYRFVARYFPQTSDWSLSIR